MSKNFLILLLFGLLGGIIGGYSFILINDKYFADISDTVIPTPSASDNFGQGLWEKAISEAAPSLVGLQVFQADKLVKQGSGIIVSSDGLIVTIADLAIPGAVYQIFYDDKILRGSAAAVDYKTNLLLIKTSDQFANVTDFSLGNYRNGQEIAIVGKLVDFSKPVLFSQRGAISYITEKSIIVDTMSNINNLSGAGVIDPDDNFLGILFSRSGKANLIQANLIEDFFRKYTNR